MIYIWTSTEHSYLAKTILPVLKGVDFKIVPLGPRPPAIGPKDVLLACGTKAIEVLASGGTVPKNRTVSTLRGKVHGLYGGSVLCTNDPKIINMDADKADDLIWDARLVRRLHETGSTEPKIGVYNYVKDFKNVLSRIEEKYQDTGKPVPISIDLETIGLDPFALGTYIVSISVTIEEGEASVVYFGSKKEQYAHPDIKWQMATLNNSEKIKVRGANYKYDMLWQAVHLGITKFSSFTCDTNLIGSLLNENRSNSLNFHAKVYTQMGGYDDCVSPDTLVCTDDLRWVPVGDIVSGDGLLGFDEDCTPKNRRKLLRTVAISTKRLHKLGMELTFSNGTIIKCSADHGFLAHKRANGNGPFTWVRARDLVLGCRMQTALDMEPYVESYMVGYLAGIYDGEGYVSSGGLGIQSGVSQQPGLVWDKYTKGMHDLGLGGFYSNQKNGDGVHTSKHTGATTLRMLQKLRPVRLLDKYSYHGKCIPSGTTKVYLKSIKFLGSIEVVSLETDCHTFVAEGICSHNSFNATYDKARMDLVPKGDLLNYAGGDTDACLRVSNVQLAELQKDKRLRKFYTTILLPAAKACMTMEHRGILVDKERYKDLRVEVETDLNKLQAQAFSKMSRRVTAKYADNLSLTRDVILREHLFTHPAGLRLKPLLFTEKKKEPSTTLEHLEMLAEKHDSVKEFVDIMRDFNSAKKTLTTYIDGFMKHLRRDGKFHPSYMMYRGSYGDKDDDSGCVTGRCLVGLSKIITDKGELPIADIVSRFEQGESFSVLTHRNRWQKVTAVYNNGIKPVCTVTAEGHCLTSTYNHPYMSFPSWTLADDLKQGDYLYAMVRPPEVEEWRPIPGWPFEVSNMGRVQRATDAKNAPKGMLVAQTPKGRWGHLKVTLTDYSNGEKRKIDFPVHRLVALVFIGEPPEGKPEVSHCNGDAGCNWVTNLEWVSVIENRRMMTLHGTADHSNQKKMNWAGVDAIRACPYVNDYDFANQFGVSRELVRDIRLFKRWNGRRDTMTGFQPIQVTNIVDAGMQPTYDLTVESDHSFVANGLVVHNTSAKDPAYQCQPSRSKILTDKGYLSLGELVEGFNKGESYKVMTHTKEFKEVTAVYDNGVQPLYRIKMKSGKILECTGNHPILTQKGYILAENLVKGYNVYSLTNPNESDACI